MEIIIKASELLADIRSAAWLEQELHSDLDRHRRHQMADICETDNVEHVWRVLGVAVAEIRLTLGKILHPETRPPSDDTLLQPSEWLFRPRFPLPVAIMSFIREKIHEYLVAAVMADRCAVIIPSASAVWHTRAREAISSLRVLASTTCPPLTPARRPLRLF